MIKPAKQKTLIAQAIYQAGRSLQASSWYSAAIASLAIAAVPSVAIAQSNTESGRSTQAIEEVTVTAQKIEESIQDVPIAVSALSGDSMDDLKIERGEELLRAIPNANFSKANFSTYNFSIRGVGTKAVSASTDPAVAVSFNNTPLIRNRLFEQEFFDVQRLEVLRGPQGTLYGRNATAGVVNMLPNMPTGEFESEVQAEVGSYNSKRANGMFNIPLGDTLAFRFSGALTQRDGFDTNTFTGNDVNDRDLYSTRAIFEWKPAENLNANLIWQHFKEDDQRSRTGKQLCTRDPGPDMIGLTEVPDSLSRRFSQGCLPGSLYDADAYSTPNASGFAYVIMPSGIPLGQDEPGFFGNTIYAIDSNFNPYANVAQSRDLREIATSYDPKFRAENDLVQLNIEVGIGESLQFFSQTTYAKDDYYSSQDYNRYVSDPIFNDSEGLFGLQGENPDPGPTPGGVYTDPQLGPSDRILAVDISQSDNRQWSQEFRLQSNFDGRLNFSVGANYLNFESQDDYYVFNNLFTFMAEYFYNTPTFEEIFAEGLDFLLPATRNCEGVDEQYARECLYVDYNSLGQIDDQGHNYFLSRNLVETRSWALFGETYWQVTDDVKLTTGLRYTEDRKTATPVPSQLLLAANYLPDGEVESGPASGGITGEGYPRGADIEQEWQEYTGRVVLDWRADTPFTDETLMYVSLSHGYKGGGANPPRMDIDPTVVQYQPLAETFKPEFVNAIEFGTKNSLLDGSLTLNTSAFYYDYSDYQVSQIVDRISFNENFDAESWGLELEGAWQVTPSTRVDMNLGYLKTRIADGAGSIDVMNRTQGNEDWMLVRPSVQVPSNCVAPVELVETIINSPSEDLHELMLWSLCAGSSRYGSFTPDIETSDHLRYDLLLGIDPYNPLTDAPNGGQGFAADLSGNELPNAPNFTVSLGIEHAITLEDWDLKLRADYYRQSESYARVYNSVYDRLESWSNFNASVTLTQPAWDMQMQLYVKNIFDDAPITDFFTNSDDTGLSTNVFTLEPRIVGFSISKGF
ncbi:TonB-dependent receptor [Microbulbifer sp. OS29]|uniref:TonB-dependent receptor n=1 Tax=Microbulbifer okhotskensis TaxID=2926617 RepID=A0A9X2EMT4_9GAMM|nr:TonB-dependent receptor [Microbulbifer okhotskensis]MCO1335149.1 TonB-dependent receptor [Microbulbifer okhotskensis]